jgi:DNA-directed RNA polymerase specialized sigma24 family protein
MSDPLEDLIALEALGERFHNLSPLLRETLEQHYVEGRTIEEIAERQGVERNAIDARLHKARNLLKGD